MTDPGFDRSASRTPAGRWQAAASAARRDARNAARGVLRRLGARRRCRLGRDRGGSEEGGQAQPLPQPPAAGRRRRGRGVRGRLPGHQGRDSPARQRRHDAALRGRDGGRRLPGRRAHDQLRQHRGWLDRQGLGSRVDSAGVCRLRARLRAQGPPVHDPALSRGHHLQYHQDQAGRCAEGLRRPARSQMERQGRPQSALALGDGAGRGGLLGKEARHRQHRAETQGQRRALLQRQRRRGAGGGARRRVDCLADRSCRDYRAGRRRTDCRRLSRYRRASRARQRIRAGQGTQRGRRQAVRQLAAERGGPDRAAGTPRARRSRGPASSRPSWCRPTAR